MLDLENDSLNFHTQQLTLQSAVIKTPLGSMIGVADKYSLYFLGFEDRKNTARDIERIRKRLKATIEPGCRDPLVSIEKELQAYFEGKLTNFTTPLYMAGTPFQERVWEALRAIPYGETRSYAAQAASIGKATAYRAVANANGANRLSIVIPCHRIIHSDGGLGGYGGGLSRKKWLLDHERKFKG